jgi:ADP-heptose:LPS heptosyltransferase
MAGIGSIPPLDLGWAKHDIARFSLPTRFVLLVPGGAPHRPEKRWPLENYAALARLVAARGATPVVIGGKDEAALGAAIMAACPTAVDLTNQTSFFDIVGLGAGALAAIGNDTGPMHLIVAAGSPATVLYSSASDPALTQPRGARVTILRRTNLATLTVDEVAATLHIS